MAPTPSSEAKVGQIDDIQELSKSMAKLPARFVRDIADPTKPISSSPVTEIPIIDFSKLSSDRNSDEFRDELRALTVACQEWGFFQVINHGIESRLLEKMMEDAEEFFMMPLEEKNKYPMVMGGIQGYGQAFVFSEDQKLDWNNMFALGLYPHYTRMANLWPSNPLTLCETLEEYAIEIRKLCRSLVKQIAMTLGLEENAFTERFGIPVQAVRMNYYPPCTRPDLVIGLSAHSDGSALTVLQERKNSPAGLQIRKDDDWVSVKSVPGSLIINLGDTIEVLTNGKYKSVEHRAVANNERDRLSIASFFAPSYSVELGPMEEFVDENNPSKYKRYNHGEYSKHYVTSRLLGKKTLDFTKIEPTNTNTNDLAN